MQTDVPVVWSYVYKNSAHHYHTEKTPQERREDWLVNHAPPPPEMGEDVFKHQRGLFSSPLLKLDYEFPNAEQVTQLQFLPPGSTRAHACRQWE